MQPYAGPPDPTRPPDRHSSHAPAPPQDDSLARLSQYAAHSSFFRTYLRERTHYLDYLSYGALANVYSVTCKLSADGVAQDILKSTILDYLSQEHLISIDAEWQQRINLVSDKHEKEALRKLATEAPPFADRPHLSKRKTQEDERMEWASDPMGQTSYSQATDSQGKPFRRDGQNIINMTETQVPRLSQTLSNVITGLDKASSAVSQAMGLIQNVLNGIQPTKTQLTDGLQILTIARESMAAHRCGLDLSREILNLCGADLNFQSNQSSQDAKQHAAGRSFMQPTASYARVTKEAKQPRRSTVRRMTTSQREVKRAISEMKSELRVDERSVKLRSVKGNGAFSPGLVATAIAELIDNTSSTKQIVEDVRTDSRGMIYVQLCEADFEQKLDALSRRVDQSKNLLRLKNLGDFEFFKPTKCPVAGFCPMVINGINLRHSPAHILTEIWDSNSTRWGLAEKQAASHITGICRLNRRLKPEQIEAIKPKRPEDCWEPSKSVKIYVSKELLQCLRSKANNGGKVIKYEYEFLTVKAFNHQIRRCDNCGDFSTHSARACKKPTRCHHCGKGHVASECPSRPKEPSETFWKDIRQSNAGSAARMTSHEAVVMGPTLRNDREAEFMSDESSEGDGMIVDTQCNHTSSLDQSRGRRK